MKISCIFPTAVKYRISSPFGERIDPKSGIKKMHNGIDIACPVGTPIRAVLDGKIMRAGWENESDHSQGYGQRVWQESNRCYDGKRLLIVYGHLSEISKRDGEFISQYGIIGKSGNTGKTTGPHLHLGCRLRDTNTFLNFEFEESVINV